MRGAFQVAELTLMIRATRGRSMDGWMDGWMDGEDLIICVAIWTLYRRWGPLLFDDFRTRPIALRNKLRLASLVRVILEVLGAIFGGFGRPKWTPKSIFGRLFCDAFFECVLASIFAQFLEAPNLKNHAPAWTGA